MLVDVASFNGENGTGMETTVTLALDWTVTDSIPAELWEWYCGD